MKAKVTIEMENKEEPIVIEFEEFEMSMAKSGKHTVGILMIRPDLPSAASGEK